MQVSQAVVASRVLSKNWKMWFWWTKVGFWPLVLRGHACCPVCVAWAFSACMETTFKIGFTKIRSVVAKLLRIMCCHGGQNGVFLDNIIENQNSGVPCSCIRVRYSVMACNKTSFCVGFTRIAAVVAEKSQKICGRKGTFLPFCRWFLRCAGKSTVTMPT